MLEEEEEKEAGQRKKRKVYSSYTDTDRAAIGRYAAEINCGWSLAAPSDVAQFPLPPGMLMKCLVFSGEVKVDLKLSIMKELQARWIANAWNHLVAHPDIGVNGFKTAGIIKAIEDPASLSMEIRDEFDPFATD